MCKAMWETLMRLQRGTRCGSSFKKILIAFNAFINQSEFTGLHGVRKSLSLLI